jgi:hypothetical protein
MMPYVAAPAGNGSGGGRDVAVAHLACAPASVRPVRVVQWTNDTLGTRFQIAGFGVNSLSGFYRFDPVRPARWLPRRGSGMPHAFVPPRRALAASLPLAVGGPRREKPG